MKKSAFALFCERYNQPYEHETSSSHKRQVADCTRHLNICTTCNSVYEYRSPTANRGSMRVYKYSEIPRIGFPEKVCENCLDDTILVENY